MCLRNFEKKVVIHLILFSTRCAHEMNRWTSIGSPFLTTGTISNLVMFVQSLTCEKYMVVNVDCSKEQKVISNHGEVNYTTYFLLFILYPPVYDQDIVISTNLIVLRGVWNWRSKLVILWVCCECWQNCLESRQIVIPAWQTL